MVTLTPYLHFQTEAREAMTFYRDVFGGELTVTVFGDFGTQMADESYADKVMHSQLETPDGFCLRASDARPGQPPSRTGGVVLNLDGPDSDQLRERWRRLTEQGTVIVPLERQMWGAEYGECVDRYGIHWAINITEPAQP